MVLGPNEGLLPYTGLSSSHPGTEANFWIAKSKYCSECGAREKMDKQSNEYKEWWEVHKDVCSINYTGSSPAMEANEALKIWRRSIEKLNLRYTKVTFDGDSKTIKHLNDNKP